MNDYSVESTYQSISQNSSVKDYKTEEEQKVAIFDWDDTLLCTSFLSPGGYFDDDIELSENDLERIKRLITPIAKKYKLKSVYIFGSYARNEATKDSDVDILIEVNVAKEDSKFGLMQEETISMVEEI